MSSKKIFLAGLATETNTFSNIPTSRASFESTALVRGREEVFAHPLIKSYAGPIEAALLENGIEAIFGLIGFAQPSSAMVEADYRGLRDELLEGLRNAGPVDAVMLDLHGGMVAQETWDCEGDILAHVRKLVGPNIPILSVLDPHAHLTEQMVENASVMAFAKEYPHTDGLDRWKDMIRALKDIWAGTLKPTVAVVDCETLAVWPTQDGPIRQLTDEFYAAEKKDGVVTTSFIHGFPWGDTPETGSKVLVYTNANAELAKTVARELADSVIRHRPASGIPTTPIDAALDAVGSVDGLVVLAEVADNPGGGAPSDASHVLKRALERKMERLAFGLFYDPQLVRFCFDAGVGACVTGRIGGKLGAMSGEPIDFTGTVRGLQREATQTFFTRLTDRMGDAAWIQIDGIDVIVTSIRTQCYDPSAFLALGLDISACKGVVVKSSNHFTAGFGPLAKAIISLDTPGTLSTDFASFKYENLKKPRWPLQGSAT